MDESVARAPGMVALLCLSTLGFAGYALLLPAAPLWAAHGGADAAGAGSVNAVLMLATVVAQTGVPWALRRLGWRLTLTVGMVLLGLPALALAVSDALGWVLALSAVRGIGFAVLTVCGANAVAELVDAARRGRAIGVYGLSIAAPQFVLLPSAAWIAEAVDFRVVFVLAAAPVLAVPFALALGRRLDGVAPDDRPAAGGRRVLPALVLPSLVLLAVTTPGGALLTFAPQFPDGPVAAIPGLLVFTGTAAAGRWLAGGLADRHGPRRFIAPLLVLCAAGLGGCAWSVAGAGPVVLVVGMAVVGVAYGSLQNLTLVTAFAAVEARDRGVASAVWNIGFDAGTGLGALVVGIVATGAGFAAGLLVTAGLALAVAAVTLRAR